MALLQLVEQKFDANLVREMLAFATDRMMQLEIEAKTGASAGGRSLKSWFCAPSGAAMSASDARSSFFIARASSRNRG